VENIQKDTPTFRNILPIKARHRLKIASNNKCKCGKTENAKHLLLYCELYKEERSRLFSLFKGSLEASAFNLRLLLHTEVGIPNTLVFLKETNICIRKWHIERNEEEVEEARVVEEVESDWELWEETEVEEVEEVEIGEGE
jgi:hypothetical protein